ncbi:hypothetical protein B0H10DRAFT_2090356 [Mycena sp. CBHHK59/15]|nr:hypothetical protein B0H10DRAFT_2090356 [Mycena sp. CBHHK59/15]
MVLTRSSSSPRTRSHIASSSSLPTSSSPRRVRSGNSIALEVKHAHLYPLTVALGFKGTKAMKKRALFRCGRNYSPRPLADLPRDHQGHDLGIPIMNTGRKSRNDLVAGSWVQVCGGCFWCNKHRKRHVFQIVDLLSHSSTPSTPLPPDILAQPLLKELFDARAELYGTASHAATAPAPAHLAPVHGEADFPPLLSVYETLLAPAPAPMPETTPTPALTPAPTPTPAPMPAPVPGEPSFFLYIVPSMHSQPNILVSDSDDEEGELQYPLDVTLDVCTPVLLFSWYNGRATYPNDGLSMLGPAWALRLPGGPPCAGTPSWFN